MKVEIVEEWDVKMDRYFFMVVVNGRNECAFVHEAEAREAVQRIRENYLKPKIAETIYSEEF